MDCSRCKPAHCGEPEWIKIAYHSGHTNIASTTLERISFEGDGLTHGARKGVATDIVAHRVASAITLHKIFEPIH